MRKEMMAAVAGFLAAGMIFSSSAMAADKGRQEKPPMMDDGGIMPLEEGSPPAGRNPEQNQAMMQQMMGAMMGQMVESMAATMAKPDVAKNMAKFTRSYYLALVDAGFTKEEAMEIVRSAGLPNLGAK